MFRFFKVVLLSSLAVQASRVEFRIPQKKGLGTSGPVCTLGDIGGLLSHHDHDHGGVCLHMAQHNESYIGRSEAWEKGPICRTGSTEDHLCYYTNSSFGGGRGIAVLTSADIAQTFAELPAFTAYNHIEFNGFPPYEIREIPGRGNGIIANRTIERGERIMAHTALMAIHSDALLDPTPDDFKFFNSALEQLPASTQSLYASQAIQNYTEDDYWDINWDRVGTNAFEEEYDGVSHWMVVPETARMNHDCRPNAIYYFDEDTLTHYTHAARRIYPGEEITDTYVDPIQTRSERREAIKRSWGFDCTCSLCQAPREYVFESNRRIKTIQKLKKELEDFTPDSKATPEMGELLISLYEMERIYAGIDDAYILTAMAYNAVGNEMKTMEYAIRALDAHMINEGPQSWEVRRARQLMLKPREHYSWMARKLDERGRRSDFSRKETSEH